MARLAAPTRPAPTCARNSSSPAITCGWSGSAACPASSSPTSRPARPIPIAFEEEAYDLSLLPGYEFETETLRFVYSSMTTPAQTFDYDMRTRARTLRKTQEVPSGHDPADYVTRRLTAVSHDGAEVPVSLLHRLHDARSTAPPRSSSTVTAPTATRSRPRSRPTG